MGGRKWAIGNRHLAARRGHGMIAEIKQERMTRYIVILGRSEAETPKSLAIQGREHLSLLPWIAGSGPLLSGLTLDLFQFASKGHLHLRRGESGRGVFWWRHEHLFE